MCAGARIHISRPPERRQLALLCATRVCRPLRARAVRGGGEPHAARGGGGGRTPHADVSRTARSWAAVIHFGGLAWRVSYTGCVFGIYRQTVSQRNVRSVGAGQQACLHELTRRVPPAPLDVAATAIRYGVLVGAAWSRRVVGGTDCGAPRRQLNGKWRSAHILGRKAHAPVVPRATANSRCWRIPRNRSNASQCALHSATLAAPWRPGPLSLFPPPVARGVDSQERGVEPAGAPAAEAGAAHRPAPSPCFVAGLPHVLVSIPNGGRPLFRSRTATCFS